MSDREKEVLGDKGGYMNGAGGCVCMSLGGMKEGKRKTMTMEALCRRTTGRSEGLVRKYLRGYKWVLF